MLTVFGALALLLTAPSGPFSQPVSRLAASYHWLCGLGAKGIECRTPQGGRSARLPGQFVELAVGRGVCGRTAQGQVRCAPLPPRAGGAARPAPTPPAAPQAGLFAHPRYACSLDADGQPTCFGEVMRGMATFPHGEQVQALHGGAGNGCARVADGLRCWPYPLPDPTVGWTQVAVGWTEVCGLSAQGRIACQDTAWRHADYGRRGSPPEGPFVRLAGDPQQFACAQTRAGRARCFGLGTEYAGAVAAPDAPLAAWAIRGNTACGLRRSDGRAVCWGSGHGETFEALRRPPERAFTRVAVHDAQACGVDVEGRVVCWGPGAEAGHTAALGQGPVEGLALTVSGACVLRAGRIVCHNVPGPAPTEDDFTQIDSTASVVCAARRAGPAACWGGAYDLEHDRFSPPPTDATRVVVQGHEGVALRRDQRLDFWTGPRRVGPPAVAFARLAPGDETVCGIAQDGRLACWGWIHGVSARRDARAVAVGASSACAAFADGVRCWQGPLARLPEAPIIKGRAQAVWRDGDGALAWMEDGTLQASRPQAHAPRGRFTAVVAAQGVQFFYCGLREGGEPQCWSTVHGPIDVALQGAFSQLALTKYFLCGLKRDGGVACVGRLR